MSAEAILDRRAALVEGRRREWTPEDRARRRSRFATANFWKATLAFILGTIGTVLVIYAIVAAYGEKVAEGSATVAEGSTIDRPVRADIALLEPQAHLPLTADEAMTANALVPLAAGKNPPGMKLQLAATEETRERATECLTAAIYYEAGSEAPDGQRAVAQVVINRVYHPAYPKTVCGVIFQGSERPTGCQFSFTCDGSLARAPLPGLWQAAGEVAKKALDGTVFAPVGLSTHYHADYVVPYWAEKLAKTAVIGRHIFYRWSGGWGNRPAFADTYAGREPMLAIWGDGTTTEEAIGLAASPASATSRPVLDLSGDTLAATQADGEAPAPSAAALPTAPRTTARFVIPMGEAPDDQPPPDAAVPD